MRLTVLGKSPSWQDAGGACSGYLLEEQGTAVLLDCGNGVFGKLRQRIDYVDVDAVVISHLHADHFLDLIPYSYALTYAPRQQPVPVDRWPGTENPARPELHGPPGARETFRKIVGCWGNYDLIENAFDLTEYDASSELSIGPVHVTFQPVPHFTETFAMRLSSDNGSGEIVYGADSRPTEALTRFATDADLVLVEATLPRPERTGERGHLTPSEAGEHGGEATGAGAHLRRAGRRLGAPRGRGKLRRPRRGGKRGRHVRGVARRPSSGRSGASAS
jgi:ribonuclease BN (tRNA processing enzyme)